MAKTIASFPIDFDLYDDDHQQVLFITDDIAGQNLTLEVTNTSDKPVSPQVLDGDASASNYHFELVFRPGTLYNVQPAINLKSDLFELFMDKENGNIKPNEDGTLSLFFKSKGAWMLHEGEKLLIKLGQIRAEATDGTRGTRVMLKYRNLLHAGNQDAFSGFREMFLNIVNHRGKKNIPLHFGFVSSNKVLNDGNSTNILKLRITNSSRNDIAIETSPRSKLVLSMESGPSTQEWAMATDGQVKNITVRYGSPVDQLYFETTGTLTWEIPFVKLEKGAFIDVEIKNLVTEHPTGQANVFMHYENIPGYWDGEIVVVAEKGPLVYKNKNVGIGTAEAHAKLAVVPPADGRGIEVLSPSAGNTHLPWTNNWNYISGNGVIFRDKAHTEKLRFDNLTNFISFGYGAGWSLENKKFLEFKTNFNNDANRGQVHFYAPSNHGTNTPVMTLTGNNGAGGKVGIGTGTGEPSEMLEVKGNVKAESFIGAGAFVRGMIVMWSGAINDIPPTWALCDSQNGTPDLRDRFIVGAGHNYTPGATGGQDAVALTEHQMPAHAHSGSTAGAGQHQHWMEGTDADGLAHRRRTIPGTTTVDMGFGGGRNSDPDDQRWRGHVNTDTTGQHSHSFSTNAAGGNAAHENRPPYYALAFIMKL